MAKRLDMPMNYFTSVHGTFNGPMHGYWRIGTRTGDTKKSYWDELRQSNEIGLGWGKVGDLSGTNYDQESKDKIKAKLMEVYQYDPQRAGQATSKVFYFAAVIKEGDIIAATDGAKIVGLGRVSGEYRYRQGEEFPHRIPVRWISTETWTPPDAEGQLTAIAELKKPVNLIAIEQRLLDPKVIGGETVGSRLGTRQLGEVSGKIQSVLQRKKQIILYGPPGTGKTYWANKTTHDLAALGAYGKFFNELAGDEKNRITGGTSSHLGLVRRCTFHPAYGYEDFIEGYRPVSINDQLSFEKRSGIFKSLCEDARDDPDNSYFLVIDEINRGDIPRIFGELITLLEKDKRGQPILLPLSGDLFQVPENVYVIGTMNTADRSIALLDTALRRRFGFYELMPDTDLLKTDIDGLPLGPWLEALNERIRSHIGRDARNLQIGHAYFLEGEKPVADKSRFIRILREDILPLLEEYCYEDYDKLAEILGDQLVDVPVQQFNQDLLDPDQWGQLLQALLAMKPELITSSKVIRTQLDEPEELEEAEEPDAEPS